MEETTMERLVYIKSMHQHAEELAEDEWPRSSMAVLLFHDAVELFLHLREELDGGSDQGSLLAYFNSIQQRSEANNEEEDIEIEYKGGIKRLNSTRNDLKHRGYRPDDATVLAIRELVEGFFERNTPILFDISYAELSMTSLVQFDQTQSQLRTAEQRLAEAELREAAEMVAAAYENMMLEFDTRRRTELEYRLTPRYRRDHHPDIRGENLFDGISQSTEPGEVDTAIDEAAVNFLTIEEMLESVEEQLKEAYDIIQLQSLGIEYSQYRRFKRLTPKVTEHGEPYNPQWSGAHLTVEKIQFCIDFVISVARELQGFPIDLETDVEQSYASFSDF